MARSTILSHLYSTMNSPCLSFYHIPNHFTHSQTSRVFVCKARRIWSCFRSALAARRVDFFWSPLQHRRERVRLAVDSCSTCFLATRTFSPFVDPITIFLSQHRTLHSPVLFPFALHKMAQSAILSHLNSTMKSLCLSFYHFPNNCAPSQTSRVCVCKAIRTWSCFRSALIARCLDFIWSPLQHRRERATGNGLLCHMLFLLPYVESIFSPHNIFLSQH